MKGLIGKKVAEIKSNAIHERIRSMDTNNIITTNCEFALEGITPKKSGSIIDERLYSVFRKYVVNSEIYLHKFGCID